LWTTFETIDIYRFLTGEEDTVPEFQYNWTTVPKLQPLGPTNSPSTQANAAPPASPQRLRHLQSLHQVRTQAVHPPQAVLTHREPHLPQAPGLNKQHFQRLKTQNQILPELQPQALLQQPKLTIYNNALNSTTRTSRRAEFRKRCSKSGASVRKSVAKVRKMFWQNFSHQSPKIHPHHLRPPQNEPGPIATGPGSGAYQREEPRLR
jgi:hypothetical protein